MAKAGANVVSELKPRITVIGVGGAGCNAINNMIASGLTGVSYIAANTDAQALSMSSAEQRLQLGVMLTEGLGAGSKPEIGEAAAEEAVEDIRRYVEGSHMVFIAAGMGGGTGTGAASVIARIAREEGALTVGIVSKPFNFEGTRRMRTALQGIEQLRTFVDTLIVIPNQNLFRLATNRTTFAEAFQIADQVLYSGVACIVDLILKDGLINLDFADVRTIMSGMGTAVMGTGEASGERRATIAAEEAIANPLLEELTLAGARGVLLSIIGGNDLTLYEVDEAASRVRKEVDADANIIVGATFDSDLGDRVRVSIVATGMDRKDAAGDRLSPAPAVNVGHHAAVQAPKPSSQPVLQPSVAADPAPAVVNSAAKPPASPSRATGERAVQPPMPPAPPQRKSGSDPYLGDTEAEDFAEALARALAEDTPAAPQRGQATMAPREVWQGPDGVTIETGRIAAASPRPPAAVPEVPTQAAAQAQFVPAPPAAMPRPPMRMPAVDEFPLVGQRAYYGQRPAPPAGGADEASSATQQDVGSVSGGSRADQRGQPRRPNLLERITGMRLKGDSLSSNAATYPQDDETLSKASRGSAAQSHVAGAKRG